MGQDLKCNTVVCVCVCVSTHAPPQPLQKHPPLARPAGSHQAAESCSPAGHRQPPEGPPPGSAAPRWADTAVAGSFPPFPSPARPSGLTSRFRHISALGPLTSRRQQGQRKRKQLPPPPTVPQRQAPRAPPQTLQRRPAPPAASVLPAEEGKRWRRRGGTRWRRWAAGRSGLVGERVPAGLRQAIPLLTLLPQSFAVSQRRKPPEAGEGSGRGPLRK